MLMAVKNNMRFFINCFITNLKSVFVYKTMFILQSSLMFINNMFFITMWIRIYQNTNIVDFSFYDILSIQSVSTIAYGITYFLFGGVCYINRYIVDCTFDSYLLQPKNVLLNVLISKCDFSAFGDITSGIFLACLACSGDFSKWCGLIFFGIFSSAFFIATEIILRTLSIWLGDTDKLSQRYIHTLLCNFSFYPVQIFPKWIRYLLYTFIPSGFISHLPLNILNIFTLEKLLIYILSVSFYLMLAIILFNHAIKSYNSGNSLNVRI